MLHMIPFTPLGAHLFGSGLSVSSTCAHFVSRTSGSGSPPQFAWSSAHAGRSLCPPYTTGFWDLVSLAGVEPASLPAANPDALPAELKTRFVYNKAPAVSGRGFAKKKEAVNEL